VVFLLEFYFTSVVLGLYAFAFRILKAPLSLIGSALAQVFFEKATRAIENGQSVRPLFYELQKKMFIISIVPFTILFFYAPEIFSFVFSAKYNQAGQISQILVPWIFLNFLISPFSNLPIVLNQQKGAFFITIIDFVLKICSLAIGGYTKSFTIAFTMLSASGSLLYIFAIGWYYYIAGKVSQFTY
jgi:O-antigen/teichoic acid export membrane protein